MKLVKVPMPERFERLDVDKLMDRIIGFGEWVEKWRNYHLNKQKNDHRRVHRELTK